MNRYYKILWGFSRESLALEVSECIEAGWLPTGGVAFETVDEGTSIFMQAVYRLPEKENMQ